jgi:transketolase N-terminal domain/subunit
VPGLQNTVLMVDINTAQSDGKEFEIGQSLTLELPKTAITVYANV